MDKKSKTKGNQQPRRSKRLEQTAPEVQFSPSFRGRAVQRMTASARKENVPRKTSSSSSSDEKALEHSAVIGRQFGLAVSQIAQQKIRDLGTHAISSDSSEERDQNISVAQHLRGSSGESSPQSLSLEQQVRSVSRDLLSETCEHHLSAHEVNHTYLSLEAVCTYKNSE